MTSVQRTMALLVLFYAFWGSEARSRALLQGQTLHAPRLFTMLTPISESSSLLPMRPICLAPSERCNNHISLDGMVQYWLLTPDATLAALCLLTLLMANRVVLETFRQLNLTLRLLG
jgi:hypothetical protein